MLRTGAFNNLSAQCHCHRGFKGWGRGHGFTRSRYQIAKIIGDTAYGTAPMLAWMVNEKDIGPHVPVWDKTERKNWDREGVLP
jgi:hypothetical protein